MQPLPPWLTRGGGRPTRPRGPGGSLRWMRGPALLLAAGALGWLLHAWRYPPTPAAAPPAPPVAQVACPAQLPCVTEIATPAAHSPSAHGRGKPAPRALALRPLPDETGSSAENRRDALRAYAQHKANDLRGCLGDPGRGPLRRVGAALEIDAHGVVAAVQILGGDGANRALESCYSAHLRTWRFPQALLQGDERLLVNFVL
jgi:hypothetical protein